MQLSLHVCLVKLCSHIVVFGEKFTKLFPANCNSTPFTVRENWKFISAWEIEFASKIEGDEQYSKSIKNHRSEVEICQTGCNEFCSMASKNSREKK